eukprot:6780181-Ditylum_brightwellii.AAC.1
MSISPEVASGGSIAPKPQSSVANEQMIALTPSSQVGLGINAKASTDVAVKMINEPFKMHEKVQSKGVGAALETSITFQTENSENASHAVATLPSDNDTNKQSTLLVDTYSPYIHPDDTSLDAARKRLRTALDQTRILRAAFTDRVYKKYRVVLRPVEKSVDEIIEKITSDAASSIL